MNLLIVGAVLAVTIGANLTRKTVDLIQSNKAAASLQAAGYVIQTDLQFAGKAGGFDFDLTGASVNDIYAHLEAIHPTFNTTAVIAAANQTAASHSVGTAASISPAHADLDSLSKRNKNGLLCCPVAGQNFQECGMFGVWDGVNALKGIDAAIGVNARSCGLLYQNHDFACWSQGDDVYVSIWICNDNYWWINPNSYYLATYAIDLINSCTVWNGPTAWACGQEFDSDRYNVIVAGGNC